MESQIKQLKLNATNIKSTLFNSNKKLKKLRVQERNLFRNQQIERKREQKEAFVESQKTGGGILRGIGSKLISGPMSLFDRIKQFFGTILLGILINNLPKIYEQVQKFLDENKGIIETIKTVINVTGKAIMGFIDVFNSAKDIIGDLGNTITEIKKELDEIGKFATNIVNETSLLNKNILDLDKEFKDEYKEVVKENVVNAIKESGGNGNPPITRKQFVEKASEYRKAKGSSGETKEVKVPGIGSYQRVSQGGLLGFLGIGTKEIAKDTYGQEIDPKDFDRRYNIMVGSQSEIFENLKKAGIESYSTGGTIGSSMNPSGNSFSRESGIARKARESTESFNVFESNSLLQSDIIDSQEENNKKFEELVKNFGELYKKDILAVSTVPPGGQPPGGQPPGTIPPPDPNAKGSVITFDSAQGPDASGEPGVDFSFADIYKNYAIFPGKVVEVGSLYGAGYGRHVVVRSTDTNGKKFDALYAHFGNFAVKEGDMVQAGDYLGSVGWDIKNNRPMSGAGNMTGPHTSVDFYKANTYRGEVTGKYPGSARLVQLIVKSANKDVKNLNLLGPPVTPKKANTSGGQRYGIITQTFDDSGDTQVAMIFAQQPVIVPGPTRYITRTITQPMPYPVAIHPKSSGLRSLV